MSERLYRVRRGWRGKAILQMRVSVPLYLGVGAVEPECLRYEWVDVDYDRAPAVLHLLLSVKDARRWRNPSATRATLIGG